MAPGKAPRRMCCVVLAASWLACLTLASAAPGCRSRWRGARQPALHRALAYGGAPELEAAIAQGAPVDATDSEGQTALDLAAEQNRLDAVAVLLRHRAGLGGHGPQARAPLHHAARCDSLGAARLLLQAGADVNATTTDSASTALHVAAYDDGLEVGKLLLAHGATLEARGSVGETPLHRAVQSLRGELIEPLLQAGAHVDACDDYRRTPLHYAVSRSPVAVVNTLLAHGANAAAADTGGQTPLHVAAQGGRDDLIPILVGAGAPLDAQETTTGTTALGLAAFGGKLAAVQALLRAGASTSTTDYYGRTPLDLAQIAEQTDVVQALSGSSGPGGGT